MHTTSQHTHFVCYEYMFIYLLRLLRNIPLLVWKNKKQEIINTFNKQLSIENYSEQTIKGSLSALELFLNFIEKLNVNGIAEKEIQDYLFYWK